MQITPNIPRQLTAEIMLPTSKSISNRALLLQALCPKRCFPIRALAICDDTEHMQYAVEAKKTGAALIDIGATGTAMRFLTAYLAISEGETTLTGSERMQQRPIGTLVDALRQLGADIAYTNKEGYPPLKIRGKQLQGGELEIEAGISSQYISALLMIAPCLTEGLKLQLKGTIASRSYIDLTLDLMRQYGVTATWENESTIHIPHGTYTDTPLTVEGDWSAASYWYELAAVGIHRGYDIDILLHGLTRESHQGDRVVADLFESLGVMTEYTTEGARLRKRCNHTPLPEGESKVIDFSHCPDIAQTLAVTCCLLGIPYIFKGVHSLRIKETDRLTALITELRKLGFVLHTEGDNCLVWDGSRIEPEATPVISTYDDHRMAMSFAAATLLHENLSIEHPEVVSKSYPDFWADMETITIKPQ